jgi:cell division protein FtsB
MPQVTSHREWLDIVSNALLVEFMGGAGATAAPTAALAEENAALKREVARLRQELDNLQQLNKGLKLKVP